MLWMPIYSPAACTPAAPALYSAEATQCHTMAYPPLWPRSSPRSLEDLTPRPTFCFWKLAFPVRPPTFRITPTGRRGCGERATTPGVNFLQVIGDLIEEFMDLPPRPDAY